MANKRVEQDAPREKAKVRVFFAEVEGNNESVKEALKTMVAAMGRSVQVISSPKHNGNGNGAAALETVEPPVDVEETGEAGADGAEESSEAAEEKTRKVRGSGNKRDYNVGIELVPELNFRPEGKETLQDFFSLKGPKNDQEMILVIVYYLQNTLGVPAIGPGHIRTAFKDVGKSLPADLRQTLRNMKKQKAWLQFTDMDSIKVSTVGDNVVDHDLGKASE